MPMIGSNLNLRSRGRSKYTYLDWLASDGTLEVVTDFMYELTTWPVEADVRVDEYLSHDNGCWRAVVAAGSQTHSMQKMSVSAQFEHGGKPCIGAWMNNGIYDPDSFGMSDTSYNGRFREHVIYQTVDDPVQNTMVAMCDGQSVLCSDKGWGTITGSTVPPCPVTFFFCLDPVDGAHLQHSKSSVRRLAIYSSSSLEKKLAEFVPAMDRSGAVGMLEQVSGVFYPALCGSGTFSLDGAETRFYDGVAP